MTTSTLVFFGPQLTRLSQSALTELRESLSTNVELSFLIDVVTELRGHWPTLIHSYPDLERIRGAEQLDILCSYIQGKASLDQETLDTLESNIIIAPLTVISHVVGFLRHCDGAQHSIGLRDGSSLKAAQGFCIGFLSAAAVSCSRNLQDFKRYAAVALRLSVCVGALVDLEQHDLDPETRSTAMVLRWTTSSQRLELDQILALYPSVSFLITFSVLCSSRKCNYVALELGSRLITII